MLVLKVSAREESVVALHLPKWAVKNPLWFGAGIEMRTQYLLADDLATASSEYHLRWDWLSTVFGVNGPRRIDVQPSETVTRCIAKQGSKSHHGQTVCPV